MHIIAKITSVRLTNRKKDDDDDDDDQEEEEIRHRVVDASLFLFLFFGPCVCTLCAARCSVMTRTGAKSDKARVDMHGELKVHYSCHVPDVQQQLQT